MRQSIWGFSNYARQMFNSAQAVTKFMALSVLIEEHLPLVQKNLLKVAIIASEIKSVATSK